MKKKDTLNDDIREELLYKHVLKESTTSEKEEVEKWLKKSELHREKYAEIRQVLSDVDGYLQKERYDSDAAWKQVKNHTLETTSSSRPLYIRMARIAAVVLIVLSMGSIAYFSGLDRLITPVYAVEAGDQMIEQITLPDGSTVSLNRNSKLEYPGKFKGETREVKLIGEAFFDVQQQPDKPFIIYAGESRVTVLGTAFNINAYPNETSIEVIVEHGKVEVTQTKLKSEPAGQSVLLLPGEKSILNKISGELWKSENDNHNYLAWKTHKLVFDDTPMTEVIHTLEKIYNVEIATPNNALNDRVLNATFEDKPIDFILNVLQLTFDLELKYDHDIYTLTNQDSKQVKP